MEIVKSRLILAVLAGVVLFIVVTAGVSFLKSQRPDKARLPQQFTTFKSPSGKPAASPAGTERKVKTAKRPAKSTSAVKNTSGSTSNSTPDEIAKELQSIRIQKLLIEEKAKLLKAKLTLAKNEKQLKELNGESEKKKKEIVISDRNILLSQIHALQRQVDELKRSKSLSAPVQFPARRKNYKLRAIVGNEALLVDDSGKTVKVKSGDVLDGRKVSVLAFSVKIGDEEVPLEMSSSGSSLAPPPASKAIPTSLIPPALRKR